MQSSVVPITVSDGVRTDVCLLLLHVGALVSVCVLCARQTPLGKRFFETARCSDSVYVMGEGKGGGLTDKWEPNAFRSILS